VVDYSRLTAERIKAIKKKNLGAEGSMYLIAQAVPVADGVNT
jgi:hypothetical protein